MRLTPEGGVRGDAWARDCPAKVESQITVMQLGVAKLVAGEQPLTLFGGGAFRLSPPTAVSATCACAGST